MQLNGAQLLRFHRSMLADEDRLDAFRRAIEASVHPGDAVLDLGSGSGVLAILAARAGARIVYAVEATEIIEIARQVARENGVEDRIVFIDDYSTRVQLPEPADVLITETIGNFGLDEGILGWVRDARKRLLKPQAIVVPQSIELLAAPVELADAYAQEVDWNYKRAGIDFRAMRPFAVNNLYSRRLEPRSYLAEPQGLGAVDLADAQSTTFTGDSIFEVQRSGRVHGLGGWFSSRLCGNVTVSNDPALSPGSWNHAFLPVEEAVHVEPGDRLAVHVSCSNNGAVWQWRLELASGPSRVHCGDTHSPRFDHSTFFGAPAITRSLHLRAEDYKPRLNPDGEIVSFILAHVDGRRTIDELAELVLGRFPDRFQNITEALEHVRAIVVDLGR